MHIVRGTLYLSSRRLIWYLIRSSLSTRKRGNRASLVLQVSLNKRRERQLRLLSIYSQFPKLAVIDLGRVFRFET